MSLWIREQIKRALPEARIVPLGDDGLSPGGEPDPENLPPPPPVTGVSIDTRTLVKGDLFVAIRGENADGHMYIPQALENGASAIIAERSAFACGGDRKIPVDFDDITETADLILVGDSLAALQDLARYRRGELSGIVIGVTGSSGKTTTRDMIYSLAQRVLGVDSVFSSTGNLNNHIGLPLCMARAPLNRELYIFEMGMNHAGEISFLSKIARPHLSIITSISEAHIEFFDDIDGIAKAKLEILDGMGINAGNTSGHLLFPAGNPGEDIARIMAMEKNIDFHLFSIVESGSATDSASYSGEDLRLDESGLRFVMHHPDGFTLDVSAGHYFNPVMASNLLGSIAILDQAGLSSRDLVSAVMEIRPLTPRRFQLHRLRFQNQPFVMVDDSYNANRDSFRRALEGLRQILPEGRLLLFAGEMAELGDEYSDEAHRDVGEYAARLHFDGVISCGSEHARILVDSYLKHKLDGLSAVYPSVDGLLDSVGLHILNENGQPYDGILIKGSRSARMDKVCDLIKELCHA